VILDHIGFNVSDFAKTKDFLVSALAPLEMVITSEGDQWATIGREGEGHLWFGLFGNSPGPMHVAFAARTREQVRRFYAAGLAAGGRDNGAPGIRAHYHPNYYGAFIIGPDGHNFEAVCHSAEA
jgi:catechol 2,3-dioxygenase-like lactoylglutathione lyase family enzyme